MKNVVEDRKDRLRTKIHQIGVTKGAKAKNFAKKHNIIFYILRDKAVKLVAYSLNSSLKTDFVVFKTK